MKQVIVAKERKPQAKILDTKEYGAEFGLREGTKLHSWMIAMIFNEGGMGDFLNYSAATKWVAEKCPWVHGRLFCPKYLVELMSDIHEQYTHWRVYPSEEFNRYAEGGMGMCGPSIVIDGANTSKQLLTCLGAHPIDVGFAYYAGSTVPADGLMLPQLDYKPVSGWFGREYFEMTPGQYVVIPTGAGVRINSRRVFGHHINPIIYHVRSLGLTPVFLGRDDLLMDGTRITSFPDDIEYDLGVDLRNKTTVKQAAAIMQHAACTVGLDCGLLHLAAMMRDSRLIFAYNITSVEHRTPRRNWGKTINISLSESELVCIGCQSKLKQIARHQFTECLYKDTKCIDLLFADGARRFRDAIDNILS